MLICIRGALLLMFGTVVDAIVDGNDAAVGAYPWLATLIEPEQDNGHTHSTDDLLISDKISDIECGGAIIHKRYVVMVNQLYRLRRKLFKIV